MPILPLTPTTVQQGQQQGGQHIREVHRSKRPHHHLGLPTPAAILTAAVFIRDADAPTKKGERKESAFCKPDKIVFVIVINYGNLFE